MFNAATATTEDLRCTAHSSAASEAERTHAAEELKRRTGKAYPFPGCFCPGCKASR